MPYEITDINENNPDSILIIENDREFMAKYGSAILRINSVEFILKIIITQILTTRNNKILKNVNSKSFGNHIIALEEIFNERKIKDNSLISELKSLNKNARRIMAHWVVWTRKVDWKIIPILSTQDSTLLITYELLESIRSVAIIISKKLTDLIKSSIKTRS